MSNEVAVQKAAGGLTFQLPAHLAARMAAAGGGNMQGREGTNQLSFKDGVWTMKVNGEAKKLERFNDETGEMEAMPVVHAIVLNQGPWSRNYYPAYDEGNPAAPDCWSEGGKKPHASVDKPIASSCDTCPMSQKGSRPTASNPDGSACKSFQLLALQPVKFDAQADPQFDVRHDAPPLRLKLAPTGIYDTRDNAAQAQGWLAWRQYTDFLTANGARYTSSAITRIRGSGKKIQFKLVAFTEPDDFDRTLITAETEEVKKLLEFSISKGKPGKALPQADAPVDGPGDFPPPGNAVQEAELKARYVAEAQAKQAAQAKAKEAEAKAEADLAAADKAAAALIAAKLEADTKAARKAAKVAAAQAAAAAAAEAARLAAEADSDDEDGWDEPATAAAPTAPVTPPAALDGEVLPPADSPAPVKPKPARRTAAPETPVAPVEVPASLASCLPAWDD